MDESIRFMGFILVYVSLFLPGWALSLQGLEFVLISCICSSNHTWSNVRIYSYFRLKFISYKHWTKISNWFAWARGDVNTVQVWPILNFSATCPTEKYCRRAGGGANRYSGGVPPSELLWRRPPPRSKIFLNKFFNPRSGLLRRFDNLSISLLCIAFFVRLCRCGNSLRFHKKEGLHKLFFTSLSLYLWYSGGPPKVAVPLLLSTLVAVLRSQGFIITNLDYHRPLSVLSNKLWESFDCTPPQETIDSLVSPTVAALRSQGCAKTY